jgi:hypothetical protein
MRDRRPYTPPEPVYRRPWSLAGLLDHAMAFLTVTIAGWWISILVEWAGIGFHWWDLPGAAHSQDVLRTELSWLKADFTAAEFTPARDRLGLLGCTDALSLERPGMDRALDRGRPDVTVSRTHPVTADPTPFWRLFTRGHLCHPVGRRAPGGGLAHAAGLSLDGSHGGDRWLGDAGSAPVRRRRGK